MLTIEQYIAKRKSEDGINEFNTEQRLQNMKICTDYVFEYFSSYLDITRAEEKTVLHNEKLEKYRGQFESYDPEVASWLVDIYDQHGKHMNRQVAKILQEDTMFYLYNTEAEFRSLSYDCYSKLIKKLPFLKEQTEMLYLFIKEYHRVNSQPYAEFQSIYITEEVNEWITNTWNRYGVNIMKFAHEWVSYFSDHHEIWPSRYKKKCNNVASTIVWYDYDYKQKSNLFNLDSLYRKIPKKAFIKGRKQELEILMMYYWLHSIESDKDNYWKTYLELIRNGAKNRDS